MAGWWVFRLCCFDFHTPSLGFPGSTVVIKALSCFINFTRFL